MQVLLGAGGAIGKDLTKELYPYTDRVRLVSRHPKKISERDELFAADITQPAAVAKAVQGAEVVYLVAGLEYKTKVWQEQWPKVMRNVIDACKMHGAKLVFFDNIYMYDPNSAGYMTEENPVHPTSKKGKVRAAIAKMILDEVKAGNLAGMIVRSADFYGPNVANSVLQETVYKNLKKGKKAQWLGDARKVHSFTYVPDAAKATALLGNTPDAYNQVWHLPTSDEKITGKELIELFAQEMRVKPRYSTVSMGMLKIAGLFISIMKEMQEMLYQNTQDYFFDCTKFKKRFPGFSITPYLTGIHQTVEAGKTLS